MPAPFKLPFGNSTLYDQSGAPVVPSNDTPQPPQTSGPMGLSPEVFLRLLTLIAPPKPAPPQTGPAAVIAVRG